MYLRMKPGKSFPAPLSGSSSMQEPEKNGTIRVAGETLCARQRAARLGLELAPLMEEGGFASGAALVVGEDRLGLAADTSSEGKGGEEVHFPDWSRIDTRSPAGRRSGQPLLRAVEGRRRRKNLLIWDLTAGWGEDAWILASLGHRVVAVERHPLVHACLKDAWSRAAIVSSFAARRLKPLLADSWELLRNQGFAGAGLSKPDVVYLDPLFPHRRKRGREKKPMRILRRATQGQGGDPLELISAALSMPGFRLVLKRPPKAEELTVNGRSPLHRVQARGYRYDLYLS